MQHCYNLFCKRGHRQSGHHGGITEYHPENTAAALVVEKTAEEKTFKGDFKEFYGSVRRGDCWLDLEGVKLFLLPHSSSFFSPIRVLGSSKMCPQSPLTCYYSSEEMSRQVRANNGLLCHWPLVVHTKRSVQSPAHLQHIHGTATAHSHGISTAHPRHSHGTATAQPRHSHGIATAHSHGISTAQPRHTATAQPRPEHYNAFNGDLHLSGAPHTEHQCLCLRGCAMKRAEPASRELGTTKAPERATACHSSEHDKCLSHCHCCGPCCLSFSSRRGAARGSVGRLERGGLPAFRPKEHSRRTVNGMDDSATFKE
uniref:Uncharacterized protein n=1 Tax=Knipowitschia caucasica TaxID=637954 RepID=A0AAV2LFC8_KNICA